MPLLLAVLLSDLPGALRNYGLAWVRRHRAGLAADT